MKTALCIAEFSQRSYLASEDVSARDWDGTLPSFCCSFPSCNKNSRTLFDHNANYRCQDDNSSLKSLFSFSYGPHHFLNGPVFLSWFLCEELFLCLWLFSCWVCLISLWRAISLSFASSRELDIFSRQTKTCLAVLRSYQTHKYTFWGVLVVFFLFSISLPDFLLIPGLKTWDWEELRPLWPSSELYWQLSRLASNGHCYRWNWPTNQAEIPLQLLLVARATPLYLWGQ